MRPLRSLTMLLVPIAVLSFWIRSAHTDTLGPLMARLENLEEPKFSSAAEKAAEQRAAAITEELKTLGDHPWAGEYYFGDGLGVNVKLALAPKAGFLFEWYGCLGLYDRNYGAVTQKGEHLRLEFTFANRRRGFEGIAQGLVPIRWGARHYLIPADDVVGLCNDVNCGNEPRDSSWGRFLLRNGDEKISVAGFPDVPLDYQKFLLVRPIEAEIVSVGKPTFRHSVADFNFKDTPVTLDKGSDQGLRVGMALLVTLPRNVVESAKIIRVSPDQSEAVVTQVNQESAAPQVGWRLSTKSPWKERCMVEAPLDNEPAPRP